MKHERDIPTAAERRKLRELVEELRHLHPERQESLLKTIKKAPQKPHLDEGVLFYTLRDIGHALQLSNRTLLRYIERGELRATRIGRHYRVTPQDFEAWLKRYNG